MTDDADQPTLKVDDGEGEQTVAVEQIETHLGGAYPLEVGTPRGVVGEGAVSLQNSRLRIQNSIQSSSWSLRKLA